MKIFLAGGNGKAKIIPAVHGGGSELIIYLAGGVTGNLNPAWKKMTELTPNGFIRGLTDANFWQGGSQDIGYMI